MEIKNPKEWETDGKTRKLLSGSFAPFYFVTLTSDGVKSVEDSHVLFPSALEALVQYTEKLKEFQAKTPGKIYWGEFPDCRRHRANGVEGWTVHSKLLISKEWLHCPEKLSYKEIIKELA